MDPKCLNAIRLIKEHTRGPLAGPIKPRWLSLALPKVGKHRAWIDHVVEGVLCEIISAYWVSGKKSRLFWTGPAYQVIRKELSLRLDCRMRDISAALTFLESLGLVWLAHKARYVDGEPKGTLVYAIPDVVAIVTMLTDAQQASQRLQQPDDAVNSEETEIAKVQNSGTQGVEVRHSSPSKSGTQGGTVKPQSLNVTKRQYNAAGGRTAERVATTSTRSIGHELRGVAGGGGGEAADADSGTSPESPADNFNESASPAPNSRNGQKAEGQMSNASASHSPTVAEQVDRFSYYWTEAGRRSDFLELVRVSKSDRKALADFFEREKLSTGWFAAVAILAWQAGKDVKRKGDFDPAWACRRSTDIQSFVRLSSKILSELGANRYKVNAYKVLRYWFTDSELRQQGFNINVGLDTIEAKYTWESDENAPDYYKERGMEMPPEIRAAVDERDDAETDDNEAGDEE